MITCKEPIIRSLVKKNIIFSSYLQTLGKEKVKETYPSLALLSINALALQPTLFVKEELSLPCSSSALHLTFPKKLPKKKWQSHVSDYSLRGSEKTENQHENS